MALQYSLRSHVTHVEIVIVSIGMGYNEFSSEIFLAGVGPICYFDAFMYGY